METTFPNCSLATGFGSDKVAIREQESELHEKTKTWPTNISPDTVFDCAPTATRFPEIETEFPNNSTEGLGSDKVEIRVQEEKVQV